MSHTNNPCLTCGACCAFARVTFYWGEADDAPGGTVPVGLTEDVTPFYRAMRGTNQKQPHCIALHGAVGQAAHCTIYEKRPSPCRGFGIQYVDGKVTATPEELARCNRARALFGLPSVQVDEWLKEQG